MRDLAKAETWDWDKYPKLAYRKIIELLPDADKRTGKRSCSCSRYRVGDIGMKPEEVGKISDIVIKVLNLSLNPDTPIFLGETNLENMKKEHPEDFDVDGEKVEMNRANNMKLNNDQIVGMWTKSYIH